VLHFQDLGLSPVAFSIGPFALRWYALSYLAMLLLGWWYMRRLIGRSGAPLTATHIDDLVTFITIGVIAGGRLGFALFYDRALFGDPLALLSVWHGGMSFHGGFLGVVIAVIAFTRRHRLDTVRVLDYLACATPFGLILVRLANFVNGELWGRPTTLPWGMTFPGAGDDLPRHPSQLYQAGLEGVLMMVLLSWLFWRTDARLHRGRLMGAGLALYASARFTLEFVRQPDRGLEHLGWGLTMGQTLSLPMALTGLYFLWASQTPARSIAAH
jgi:phosphatidylglycerol:prolipoprotein diacylglycerol transferase